MIVFEYILKILQIKKRYIKDRNHQKVNIILIKFNKKDVLTNSLE